LHRVRHEHAVEERLVVILQLRQVDVFFQIVGLVRQLKMYPPNLICLGIDPFGQKPVQAQRLALGLGERGRFIQLRITQQRQAPRCTCHFTFAVLQS